MTGACSWLRLVRGSGLFIAAARPYQLLIQDGGLSMAAVVCLWRQWLVYGSSGLSMAAVAYLWRQWPVYGSSLFMEVACL